MHKANVTGINAMSNKDCITIAEDIRSAFLYGNSINIPIMKVSDFRQILNLIKG